MRIGLVAVLTSAAGLAASAGARAEKPPAEPAHLQVSGFVDTYYGWNSNRPADHSSFIPGTGSTAKRSDEFGVNLAAVDLLLSPSPVGGHVTFNVGSGADLIHVGEPAGAATGPDVWRNIYQAYVTYRVPFRRGLVLDAGVYPCHVGFEAFFSKDDWNYTRSWLAEFSPWYQSGLRVSYPFTDHLSAQLHVMNGWQVIGDNNSSKTMGTQLAWTSDRVTLSLNTMAGPEAPGDDAHWRVFGDAVLIVQATPKVSLGASADAAHQQLTADDSAAWSGVAAYARLAATAKTALTLRAEVFHDPDAGITGAAQDLREATATLEIRPADGLIVKLEGRHDHSDRDVFGRHETDASGAPSLGRDQTLIVLSVVSTFQALP